ncbi:hypothetical protein [Leptothoe sp. PORK10 BA2]|uniref:hypothetical protein n=1 Tax=Leptothoe sp. PORK10 BA2 TaxID=3110254 RepID=UPI002B202F33|nr:hypothetical protein [Leptothoe sp. PORK10 BA2]MEA5466232.1 hypothetical protein [Leptothoe sp. PORK10 BA2]
MTLAKPTSTNTPGFELSTTSDGVEQSPMALKTQLGNLATQATHRTLNLWADLWAAYRPVTRDKTQAVWLLLQSTQPVHLLLTAALAVLAIALVTLVATFNGLIVLFLKMAALVLAAVAVGQWVSRGLSWADEKLPSPMDPSETTQG